MKNLARSLSRGRRLGAAALLAGFAFLLAPLGLPGAAAAGMDRGRADMERGPAAEGTDAAGRVDLRRGPRGESVRLRLRNLEPRADYEIRDAATGEVLGRVRANRRGRAKVRLRAAGSDARALAGRELDVRPLGGENAVLSCEVPGGDGAPKDDPWRDGGTFASGWVGTDPDAAVQVFISMDSASFPDGEASFESISLVAYGPDVAGPVLFRVADGEGALRTVAEVEEIDFEAPMNDGWKDMPGGGMDRGKMSYGDDRGDGMDGCPDGASGGFFAWSAGGDDLPFGVSTVAALSGRAFEVTDGDGVVLLSGVLPALEEIVIEPPLPWEEGTWLTGQVATGPDAAVQVFLSMDSASFPGEERSYDSMTLFVTGEGVPGPVSFLVADGEGVLREVASLEKDPAYGEPGGGVVFPDGNMMMMGTGPMGMDGDRPDGSWPDAYSWYADGTTGEGLPFGVETVAALSGRAFEVRDGEGALLLSGVLPELEEITYEPMPVDGDPSAGNGLGR